MYVLRTWIASEKNSVVMNKKNNKKIQMGTNFPKLKYRVILLLKVLSSKRTA